MGVPIRLEDKKVKLNKSFFFLFPLFKINDRKGIINTFIGDYNQEHLFDNKLYILCDSVNKDLASHTSCVDYYKAGSNMMYVFEFPDEFKEDYKNFLSGKYSKYSKEAKNILCQSACRNSLKSPHQTEIYSVLHKTLARKEHLEKWLDVKLDEDAEYASIFNIDLEVYDG